MRYLGSKAKIAKDIVPIIQSYIDNNSIEQYWEPFVGGANIIDKINCKVRVGTDIHPQLIALLQQAQTDISVFPDTISEEEYKEVKNNKDKYPDWYVGLVGFCSFGSKYWGGIEEAMTKKAEPKMKRKV
jgi:site-specific DNA-adenine methylase